MTKTILYNATPEFQKDFKRLLKKFRSLESDLELAKSNIIELRYIHDIDNNGIFEISGFCTEEVSVCKIKKFACKALKSRGIQSGIRIIYAYEPATSTVTFLEMYFKADQANEDRDRIKEFLKK